MTIAVIAGLGIGTGLVLVLFGLFPSPLTLRGALGRLSGEVAPSAFDTLADSTNGLRRVAVAAVRTSLSKSPRLAAVVVPDLAVTGTPIETFAVKVVGYAIALGLFGPVMWFVMGTVGIHVGFQVPIAGVLIGGGVGLVVPFFDLHTAAAKRRRHFCHSLATYASLVSMAMAGAMGWSSALEAASSVSVTDWTMTEIAQALLWAQVTHSQPWEGLDRLAERFAIPELADLARSMSQAGEGSRIRNSLDAKAASLRLKETSALEDAAAAVTQRMLLPGVLLMIGYGILIFYPALSAFTGAHL